MIFKRTLTTSAGICPTFASTAASSGSRAIAFFVRSTVPLETPASFATSFDDFIVPRGTPSICVSTSPIFNILLCLITIAALCTGDRCRRCDFTARKRHSEEDFCSRLRDCYRDPLIRQTHPKIITESIPTHLNPPPFYNPTPFFPVGKHQSHENVMRGVFRDTLFTHSTCKQVERENRTPLLFIKFF